MSQDLGVQYFHLFILLFQRPRKINSVDRYGGLKGAVNGCNVQIGPSDNRPSKPRELLYSRHINQVHLEFLRSCECDYIYVRGCVHITNIPFV